MVETEAVATAEMVADFEAVDLRAADSVGDLPAEEVQAADSVVGLPVVATAVAVATAVRGAVSTPPRCSAVWTPTATACSIPKNSRGRRSF